MAVFAETLLLLALTSNIGAAIVQIAGENRNFFLNKSADFCSISRWTGEKEKTLLWNSSELHHSSSERGPSYWISDLTVSDSGLYQEQCWTLGNVTHWRNFTLLICDTQKMRSQNFHPHVGDTVDLACDRAGPNQSVQWAIEHLDHKTENWEISLIDGETSSMFSLQLLREKPHLLVKPNRRSDYVFYYCLEMDLERCVMLNQYLVEAPVEIFHCTEGESLELNCSDIRGDQPHVWRMYNSMMDEVSHNYTLRFPSLQLDHTGAYVCERSEMYHEQYNLYVCPESDPPAVAFFTEGENLTLPCGAQKRTGVTQWFLRSNRTDGRISFVYSDEDQDNLHVSNGSLVILNVSIEDGGEFWCMIRDDRRCVYRSKTLVMLRGPEVDHHSVRSVLVSVAIMLMCVAIGAAVRRAWSREQLPDPVEEVEMCDLSL